jgi:hypothetical protein
MGIDVKETSPFVDYSKQTTKEMKEGMTAQEIEDYRLMYLAKNFKISGRKGVSMRLYDPAGQIPSSLRFNGRKEKSLYKTREGILHEDKSSGFLQSQLVDSNSPSILNGPNSSQNSIGFR